MKRWAAITALAVMAVPVTWFIAVALVDIVQSWIWRPPVGEPLLVTMLSVETAWQLAGAVAIVGSAWWAGWYWFRAQEQMRFATRELPRCFRRPDNLLILWFLGLLACGAYSANRTFTFM